MFTVATGQLSNAMEKPSQKLFTACPGPTTGAPAAAYTYLSDDLLLKAGRAQHGLARPELQRRVGRVPGTAPSGALGRLVQLGPVQHLEQQRGDGDEEARGLGQPVQGEGQGEISERGM